jgi:hypothetical protein
VGAVTVVTDGGIASAIEIGMTRLRTALLVLTGILLFAPTAHAQRGKQHPPRAPKGSRPVELRGSKESVEKMYDFAQANHLPFYLSPTNVRDAVAQQKLVPLTGDATYELTRGVGYSYATPEARQFVQAFAPQYLAACGTPLTVTSAARPVTRQPRNANPHSVHPTGIAVDLRRPVGPCLTWVRSALAELEKKGIIEATEERRPAHLHLAVLVRPGEAVVLPQMVGAAAASRSAIAVANSTR